MSHDFERGRLSEAGQAIVREHDTRWTREAHFALTLEWLIGEWDKFARAVEAGYRGYGEEYLNDLTARDLLDEVMRGLSSADAAVIEQAIKGADDTYLRATLPDDGRWLSANFRIGNGWWWRRSPQRPLVEP
jgi:hypothetical protein